MNVIKAILLKEDQQRSCAIRTMICKGIPGMVTSLVKVSVVIVIAPTCTIISSSLVFINLYIWN